MATRDVATSDVTTGGAEARRGGGLGRAARRLTETKAAFKTTEFWAMVGVIVAILVSAAAIKGGDSGGTDEFIARQAWLYVAIVAGAYFISRGLAKSGSSEPYDDDGSSQRRGADDGLNR
jgi:hypothetical protein